MDIGMDSNTVSELWSWKCTTVGCRRDDWGAASCKAGRLPVFLTEINKSIKEEGLAYQSEGYWTQDKNRWSQHHFDACFSSKMFSFLSEGYVFNILGYGVSWRRQFITLCKEPAFLNMVRIEKTEAHVIPLELW